MLVAVCHSPATGWVEVTDLTELSELRVESGNLLWAEADVATLDDEEIALIADEFSLHPLAVEDAVRIRQRPKLESYEGHLFVVVHELDEVDGQLEASQIACFIGERYLITLHAGAERIISEAKRRWSDEFVQRDAGPGYLLHTLLDALVDDVEVIANKLEDEIENLEEITLQNPLAPVQRELYSVKQRLSRLRRYALPTERVVRWVLDGPGHGLFAKETHELFADVNDHVLRIADQVRSIEDLTDAVLDLRRGEQATALNEVTKRLTGWAAIIAVPTFIASVYGMNFALVPTEGQIFGFFFALFLMALSSLVLFLFFRHRDWI
jgi:magnesium transporter